MKNKSYVLINTLGMGIALTCCMTAYLLVAYNIEFDSYFAKSKVNDVVKVRQTLKLADGYAHQQYIAPIVLAPIAAQEVSGIEDFSRYTSQGTVVTHNNNAFSENVSFADASFFEMFGFGLKSGSYESFNDLSTIFISETLAQKYFGGENAIGKTLTMEFGNKKQQVVVGAVMEDLPLNTSFTHDAVMRIENYLNVYGVTKNDWQAGKDASILFKLSNMGQRNQVAKQLDKYLDLINQGKTDVTVFKYNFIPFTQKVDANAARETFLHPTIPSIALIIFTVLGLIILLIACFNLTNTTMALTGKRFKEVGVRKVIGAARSQIMYQFLVEIMLTIVLSIVVGLAMAQVVVPEFAAMWGLNYGMSDLNGLNFMVALIILLFLSSIIAGIYPALSSSKLRPVALLKGSAKTKGTNPLVRILLVFQFSLSVIVLIAGIIFTQNADYQLALGFGYDWENIITVTINDGEDYDKLRNAIISNPKIEEVSATANHLGTYSSYPASIMIDAEEVRSNVYEVGPNYFKVMGLDVTLGRAFINNNEAEREASLIVDENFVKNHNLADPIDKRISFNNKTYTIVGVVKNHLSGLKSRQDIDHMYLIAAPQNYHLLVARTNGSSTLEIQRNVIRSAWNQNFPGRPFDSKLQEDILFKEANEYNGNMRNIFVFLTILGCLLSASGIYSLATLNIQKRKKEIGIRKVLGASSQNIVKLINKEFVIILVVAMVLGGVGGFFLSNALLNSLYVQHIQVGVLPVLIGGLFIFLLGTAITSNTIFRATLVNPTKTLKEN